MSSLVSTQWLAKNIDRPDLRVIQIDANGLDSYQQGHIPGAVGWFWKDALWDPFMREFPTQDDFANRLGEAGIGANTTVVLYGAPVQYGTYAWWVFKMFGHLDVRVLDGGLVKWQNEGRPVDSSSPDLTPVTYGSARPDGKLRTGRDHVVQRLGKKDVVILDHRSREEYLGERVNMPGNPDVGAERYGRVPGAVHVPFLSLLNEDTSFKTPELLAKIFQPHIRDNETEVISYCRLSHRATLACFVMTEILNFRNVQVYDGSWTEWGSMVGMPIER